jgi:transposase
MLASIPDGPWQVAATDPTALTRLLDLPGLFVTRLEYDPDHASLHVFCDHQSQGAFCPTCGQISTAVHQYRKRTIRDLPWAGKTCWIEFAARRFFCASCQCPFREELDWLPRCSRLTQRYTDYVFAQCRRTSIQAVHRQERLGYKTVERLYYERAQVRTKVADPVLVRQLGIDEIALRKGHDQCVLVLSDLERGSVLEVLPDRTKETLIAYFATWTDAQRQAVCDVAMDLWEPYAQAVEACLPNARIVADRFPVMKLLNDQVTTTRRTIQREAPEAVRSVLKGGRWLLVRNETDLSAAQKERLQAMFVAVPELGVLHTLKERFRAIFEEPISRELAHWRLFGWITAVERSGLSALATFVGTLRRRLSHILNYFPARLSSGRVEGLNTKIKLIKRCAYGFRNFAHFALRVQVECDGAT